MIQPQGPLSCSYNKTMPDDTKPDTVQQDSSADPSVPPAIKEQLESSHVTQMSSEDMNAKIQNLGDEVHKAEKWMIWFTGAIAFFGLCTVLVGILQWHVMNGQLGEMKSGGVDTRDLAVAAKNQADLQREQLEGTTAAIVIFSDVRITRNPTTNDEEVVISLLNQGHVIAPEVHASLQIDTVSFVDLKTVFGSQKVTVVGQQVRDGSNWSKTYKLSNFTQDDQRFATQTRTVNLRGTFGFDNGFGRKYEQPVCYWSIGSYNTKNDDGGSTSGGPGFMPCDGFKEFVSFVRKHELK